MISLCFIPPIIACVFLVLWVIEPEEREEREDLMSVWGWLDEN